MKIILSQPKEQVDALLPLLVYIFILSFLQETVESESKCVGVHRVFCFFNFILFSSLALSVWATWLSTVAHSQSMLLANFLFSFLRVLYIK